MITNTLSLPMREEKPRRRGLTMMIDGGLPTRYFVDVVESAGDLIDFVKFGWGTALVTGDLWRKIAVLEEHDVGFFFGGTLFERFVAEDRFDDYLELVRRHRCPWAEVSNGTIELSSTEKAAYIAKIAGEIPVLSEVGFKDSRRSEALSPAMWIDCIEEDLAAGASYVITEARESGKSGICRPDGKLRTGLIEEILASGVDAARLLFEAPTKELQAYFILRLGSSVNLGNIAPTDVIGLETLRLGLRADTFHGLLAYR